MDNVENGDAAFCPFPVEPKGRESAFPLDREIGKSAEGHRDKSWKIDYVAAVCPVVRADESQKKRLNDIQSFSVDRFSSIPGIQIDEEVFRP